MRQYVNSIDVTNVALGVGTGESLTSGEGNVLLGAHAGGGLTTGSYNVILGDTTGPTTTRPRPVGWCTTDAGTHRAEQR
jgi:hypothetical protein